MSMFSMGAVKDVKTASSSFLGAGIHEVTFKGINKSDSYNAIEVAFESADGATYTERIFEPRSAERSQSQYGTNPSEAEQFMCKIKQIIDAIDPELSKKIDEAGDKFSAPDFDGFIKLLKKYLDPRVGVTTFIKLIPNNNGYVGFPGFPAKCNKDGGLYMTTKFIGTDLVLTAREKAAIDNASKAKPTKMATHDDELDDLKSDFETADDDSGLPF